ncbi:DMT family transporter [Occultella aeris]|uniref:EamA-like transporter family protein n=1 Tax=Occultella aeris TaxID=2761496 RepID=A0A7M4DLT8_9MICO|nr:DMT family transporter [Occultella aeris]VZO38268.1 EamA-like transporter family protein [Occultella aeris]
MSAATGPGPREPDGGAAFARTVPAVRSQVGGLWLGLLSAAVFATSGPIARALLEVGWSAGAAVTARIAGAALVLVVPAVLQLRGRWSLLRTNARLIAGYGLLALALTQFAYFSAIAHVTVGVALLLEYLGVILVVLWLWVRHAQRPRAATVTGVVLAVVGLVLVLDLTGANDVDLVGVLWGLAAACGLAGYFILSGNASTGLPPIVLAAGGMTVGAVALGLLGATGLLPIRVAAADVTLGGAAVPWWAALIALVLVSTVVAYTTGIAATRRLGAKLASFVGLVEVLFAIVFAWLLVGELPGLVQLLGGLLIVAGVAAIRYDELVGRRS